MLHQYVPLLLALHMPTAVRLPAAAQSMAAGTRHQPLRASASEDVGKLTIPQLKERLRAAGLKVGGRKAELVERLLAAPAATSSPEAHGTSELERVEAAPLSSGTRPDQELSGPGTAMQQDEATPSKMLLVDGMNVGGVLNVPRRTLFAMLYLLCLSRDLCTTIIFDGPSFDRVCHDYPDAATGVEKGSAEWKALAGRGAAARQPVRELLAFYPARRLLPCPQLPA